MSAQGDGEPHVLGTEVDFWSISAEMAKSGIFPKIATLKSLIPWCRLFPAEEAARPRCGNTVTFTPGIESFESFESFLEFREFREFREFLRF